MSGPVIATCNSYSTLAASCASTNIFSLPINGLTNVGSVRMKFIDEALNVVRHPFRIRGATSIENTYPISSQKERTAGGGHGPSFCPL